MCLKYLKPPNKTRIDIRVELLRNTQNNTLSAKQRQETTKVCVVQMLQKNLKTSCVCYTQHYNRISAWYPSVCTIRYLAPQDVCPTTHVCRRISTHVCVYLRTTPKPTERCMGRAKWKVDLVSWPKHCLTDY